MTSMDTVVLFPLIALVLGLVGGIVIALVAGRRKDTTVSVAAELAQVRLALGELEQRQSVAQAQLGSELTARFTSQAHFFAETAESLRREQARLSKALGRSEVRGRWGEIQLRRLVEAAGMLESVHFTEQDSLTTESGTLRPDLIIHIADDKSIVVDAKVPLDAVLSADEETDPQELRQQHAAAVANHVDRLSRKEYWRQYDSSPEFVVLFLPAESMLAEALAAKPELLDHAFDKKVVLATPTTMLALLRTVSHVWQQEALNRNVEQIHALSLEMYERLGTVLGHLSKLGSSLDSAVEAYNKTIGSMEGRVLVSGRKLHDLGVGSQAIVAPSSIDVRSRPVSDDVMEVSTTQLTTESRKLQP